MGRRKSSDIADELIRKSKYLTNDNFDRMYNSLKSEDKQRVMDELDRQVDDYSLFGDYDYRNVPTGCAACGGPYPDCRDSCNAISNWLSNIISSKKKSACKFSAPLLLVLLYQDYLMTSSMNRLLAFEIIFPIINRTHFSGIVVSKDISSMDFFSTQ